MTILYLYKNRIRPPVLSRVWFKYWAKRIWNTKNLTVMLFRSFLLRKKGATIGNLTVIEKIKTNGPCQNMSIGRSSFIGSGTQLALHDQVQIGNFVVINNNVQILTASHSTKDSNWSLIKRKIVIDDYAWIATSAIILPGVNIGKGAVIGAGAVVSKNVAPYDIVAGNPAVIVGQRTPILDYDPTALSAPYEAWLGKQRQPSLSNN